MYVVGCVSSALFSRPLSRQASRWRARAIANFGRPVCSLDNQHPRNVWRLGKNSRGPLHRRSAQVSFREP